MAVVVLVIEAAAAIPIVELSVFKAPGPASEGEPSGVGCSEATFWAVGGGA